MDTNLYREFQAAVRGSGDAVAVIDNGRRIDFNTLEAMSRRAAKALIASGIAKGDTVAIWAVNRWQWIVAALGIQAAGGVLIPCGTRLRGREVAASLTRVKTRLLFTDPSFGDYDFVAAIAGQDVPDLAKVVVFDDRQEDGRVIGFEAFCAAGDAVTDAELDARIASVGPDDLADILFTSGTTGIPKGVPMSHAQSLAACAAQHAEINKFRPDDVFAVSFPFAHNAGYRAGWQAALLRGVAVVPVRDYDALSYLRMIADHKVTILPGAPPIHQAIVDHPDRLKYDISSVRTAAVGGTLVPARLIERMQELYGAGSVMTSYGLTEAAGSVTCTQPDDSPRTIVETTGRPLTCFSVRILDADGNALPAGELGEIAIKARQVMKGYLDDPEATAKAFTPDGHFLTGDVGYIDADGNLLVTDRIKDMYIVGGFNVYPAEVEHYICGLPGVGQCAVVGIDDDRLGQVGKAFVVPSPGGSPDPQAIIAACKRDLANYKVPRAVEVIAALPTNATGKIDKKVLRG